jgi:hypothetical protein
MVNDAILPIVSIVHNSSWLSGGIPFGAVWPSFHSKLWAQAMRSQLADSPDILAGMM